MTDLVVHKATGMTRFELATSCSTDRCSRPTELHPQKVTDAEVAKVQQKLALKICAVKTRLHLVLQTHLLGWVEQMHMNYCVAKLMGKTIRLNTNLGK